LHLAFRGGGDGCDRSESGDQRSGVIGADPRNSRQQADRGRNDRPAADVNSRALREAAVLSRSEHVQPERRVVAGRRLENPNPVVGDLQERAAQSPGRDRPVIEIRSFHEEVGTPWIPSECRHLAPDPVVSQTAVQVGDRLAFYNAISERIVTDRKRHQLDVPSERRNPLRDTRPPLTHISGYRQPIHKEPSFRKARAHIEPDLCQKRVLQQLRRERPI